MSLASRTTIWILMCGLACSVGCANEVPEPEGPDRAVAGSVAPNAASASTAGSRATSTGAAPAAATGPASSPSSMGATSQSSQTAAAPAATSGGVAGGSSVSKPAAGGGGAGAAAPSTAGTVASPVAGAAGAEALPDLGEILPPPSTPEMRVPSPDNPAECPATAPENPIGDCLGLPVYLECTYGTYFCVCDWYHWLCAG